jgi:hypothetical protein
MHGPTTPQPLKPNGQVLGLLIGILALLGLSIGLVVWHALIGSP